MKYAVCIVPYRHSEAFREAAEAVHYALLALGHDSILTVLTAPPSAGIDPSCTVILFGWNLLRPEDEIPKTAILYNFEQAGSHWLDQSRTERFHGHLWWDWTLASTDQLRSQNHLVKYVPIGYVPEWERIGAPQATSEIPIAEKCFDVLFYGSMSVRRRAVLEKLEKRLGHGKVIWLYEAYGERRDNYIAHSKVVLNMHYDRPNATLEMCRVGYLLANRALMLSETSAEAEWLEGKVDFVPEYQLVRRAIELVKEPEDFRRSIAGMGYRAVKERRMTNVLRPIVGTP